VQNCNIEKASLPRQRGGWRSPARAAPIAVHHHRAATLRRQSCHLHSRFEPQNFAWKDGPPSTLFPDSLPAPRNREEHTPRRSLTPGPAIQRRALGLCQGGQRKRRTRSAQRCTARVSPQSRWAVAASLIGRSCCTAGNHTIDSDAAAASQKKQRCSACRSSRTHPMPSGHPGIEMRGSVSGCPAIPMLQLERTMGAASRCDCTGLRTREGWRAPA